MSYFNAAKGCYLREPAHFYLGLLKIFEFQENWYLYKIREEKKKTTTLYDSELAFSPPTTNSNEKYVPQPKHNLAP